MSSFVSIDSLLGGSLTTTIEAWLPNFPQAQRLVVPAVAGSAYVLAPGGDPTVPDDHLPVFDNRAGTGDALAQPLEADEDGSFVGWVAEQALDLVVEGGNLAQKRIAVGLAAPTLAVVSVSPLPSASGQVPEWNGSAWVPTAVGAGSPTIVAAGNLGSTHTLTVSATETWMTGTLNANCALTISGLSVGDQVLLLFTQDGTGGRTLSINSSSVTIPGTASASMAILCSYDGTNLYVAAPSAGGGGGAASYSATVLADSPVAYWRLGEPSGTTAADATGNGHTGTYTTGAGAYSLGAGGATDDGDTALNITTSGSYVTIPDAGAFAFGTGDFTVEAWYRSIADGGDIGILVGANAANEWELKINSSGLADFFIYSAADLVGAADLRPGSAWHHIVGVRASGVAYLYVDGVVVASAANANNASAGAAIGIGGVADGLPGFTGLVDEVALYGAALSATRILAHYNAAR